MSVDRFQGNYKKFVIINVDNIYWKMARKIGCQLNPILSHTVIIKLFINFNPFKYIEGNMHKQPPTI